MKTFRFLDFKVYQEAKEFHKLVVGLTRKFPRDYRYLSDQLRRASLSVILNIAEGSAKRSDKDFNRYLENSLGSIAEAIACLDVAFSVNLVSKNRFEFLKERGKSIKRQAGGFSRKLVGTSKN